MAKGYTVYSKNAGVEIKAVTKKNDNGSKEGRVSLRFFTLGNGSNGNSESISMRFILTPVEAYDLCLKTLEIVKNGGKKYLKHEYNDGDKKIETTLKLERWERDNKSGYAYAIKRGETKINVPMDAVTFMFAGELLKSLATDQAWFSYKRADETEADAQEEVVEEEEF